MLHKLEHSAFLDRVMPEPNSGCWFWLGAHTNAGYGVFSWKSKRRYAHRVSYELKNGPIPLGLEIDHKCRMRGCCNPDHLDAVTHRENILRGESPSAKHAKKTHCPRGHPLIEGNLVKRKNNGRDCKRCHADREKKRVSRM